MQPENTSRDNLFDQQMQLILELQKKSAEITKMVGEIAKLNEDIRTMYGSNSVIRENNQVKEENELLILEMSYLRAVMKED